MSPPNFNKFGRFSEMVKPTASERWGKEMVIENRIREANEQIIEKIF